MYIWINFKKKRERSNTNMAVCLARMSIGSSHWLFSALMWRWRLQGRKDKFSHCNTHKKAALFLTFYSKSVPKDQRPTDLGGSQGGDKSTCYWGMARTVLSPCYPA
jgi:hypothetical protein